MGWLEGRENQKTGQTRYSMINVWQKSSFSIERKHCKDLQHLHMLEKHFKEDKQFLYNSADSYKSKQTLKTILSNNKGKWCNLFKSLKLKKSKILAKIALLPHLLFVKKGQNL